MALKLTSALLTIAADPFDSVVNFYQALLDQPPQPYVPQCYAEFQLPGLKLAVFKPKDTEEFTAPSGALSLCLEVEDLTGAIALLTQLGYPPLGEVIHASHGQEIYAYDPAGSRLILHQAAP